MSDEDDFVEILPARMTGKIRPQLVVTIVSLRGAVRVQFNFAPEILDEVGGPRFDIAFSQKRRQFRIQARDLGRYEPIQPTRGNRRLLRCPLPPTILQSAEAIDPEFYVDRETRTIVVEIEDAFKPKALPAPAGPSNADLMARAKAAVPAPNFSSKAMGGGADMAPQSQGDIMDGKVLRAALGLDEPRALQLGWHRFTKTEAAIVELLARRDRVTKQAVMVATADPIGEDERDDKIADVFIHKVRPKLEALGFKVLTQHGEGWTIAASERRALKAMIAEARREAA